MSYWSKSKLVSNYFSKLSFPETHLFVLIVYKSMTHYITFILIFFGNNFKFPILLHFKA